MLYSYCKVFAAAIVIATSFFVFSKIERALAGDAEFIASVDAFIAEINKKGWGDRSKVKDKVGALLTVLASHGLPPGYSDSDRVTRASALLTETAKTSDDADGVRLRAVQLKESTQDELVKISVQIDRLTNLVREQSGKPADNTSLKYFIANLKRATDLVNALVNTDQSTLLEAELAKKPEKTAETAIALENFSKAIDRVKYPQRIHVVRAWFGHLRTDWGEGYLCDATNAVRTKCQKATSCSPDTVGGAKTLDAVALCGFDPAPIARGRSKGLVVQYSCQRGGDDHWETLARYPNIDPKDNRQFRRANANVSSVTLYSGGMSVQCPHPLE